MSMTIANVLKNLFKVQLMPFIVYLLIRLMCVDTSGKINIPSVCIYYVHVHTHTHIYILYTHTHIYHCIKFGNMKKE